MILSGAKIKRTSFQSSRLLSFPPSPRQPTQIHEDIVVRRRSLPPIHDMKDMEIVVGPLLRRDWNTAEFGSTVYFQNEGQMERGCKCGNGGLMLEWSDGLLMPFVAFVYVDGS